MRTLPLAAAVIGIACGAASQRRLPPAGSARDDGTGLLSQASVDLRIEGRRAYGGASYAGARYAGARYGGGRYANYQFRHGSRSYRHRSDGHSPDYSVDHTSPTGTIAGVVSWSAPYRPPRPPHPTCPPAGSDRPVDAVISVKNARRGPAIPKKRLGHTDDLFLSGLVSIGRCGISPRVQAVAAIGDLATAVLEREARARLSGVAAGTNQVLFELELRARGERRLFELSHAGVLELTATGAGSGWIAVFGHPLFARPDPDGSFRIARVPAGEHTVEVWHPPAAGSDRPIVETRVVRVYPGKTSRLAIKLDPRPARRTRGAGSGGR